MGHKWFLLFTVLLFISCASVKEPKQIAEPLDYTDQNIIDSEKKRITEMLQTDSVKALWRSLLLGQQSLTEECQQQVYYQFKDAIEETKSISSSFKVSPSFKKQVINPTTFLL